MKGLKSITVYTQIHQFCDNQWQKLLRVAIFSSKSSEKIFDLLKDTERPPLSPSSMLRQGLKRYVRQSCPRMSKQTWKQH